jgi:hypothetical protein
MACSFFLSRFQAFYVLLLLLLLETCPAANFVWCKVVVGL